MKDKKGCTEITEKLWFAMLLAATGGFMDMYSYTVHGNVFATGQTGNFVLVAVHLAKQDYTGVFRCIIPILSFWIGIFIAWHMFYSYFKEKQLLWKRSIIVAEIITVFIAGFIPLSCPDIIANTLVSFAASLQFCAFRKLGTSENYASIFCTGNMRSCAENYYKGIARKDSQCLKKAMRYSTILISFFMGAIISALEAGFLHQKAIWSVDVIFLSALIASFVLNIRMKRNSFEDEEALEERAV
ncbi:YoaK family protein [Clostridium neuense]|uniref:YoaK family protein n=1 Tax=Clostridium neuense TaxID=1728934 RepID=A0ABW8TER1_9CLOT